MPKPKRCTYAGHQYLSNIVYSAHVSRTINANGARCYCSHLNETKISFNTPTNKLEKISFRYFFVFLTIRRLQVSVKQSVCV